MGNGSLGAPHSFAVEGDVVVTTGMDGVRAVAAVDLVVGAVGRGLAAHPDDVIAAAQQVAARLAVDEVVAGPP